MSALGIVYNLLFKASLPAFVNNLLTAFGSLFSTPALFLMVWCTIARVSVEAMPSVPCQCSQGAGMAPKSPEWSMRGEQSSADSSVGSKGP
jgi:hypothetical protein